MPGLESIAFDPSDGVLFGAAQNGLYTIDPTTGASTFIGSFGNPYNLNLAQNIRFDSDGNLYLSNTGDNTDIYQVNTDTGSCDLCRGSRRATRTWSSRMEASTCTG